jgi:phosphoribosylformylglycinamidine cyclo-ligase
MPDFYDPGEYDLAGFVVGVVEEQGRPGAARVGPATCSSAWPPTASTPTATPSSGSSSSRDLGLDLDDRFPETDATVGDVLLRVHRSYLHAVHPVIAQGRVNALAHITGGGIPGNLSRSIPASLQARVDTGSWELPAEFRGVMASGRVDGREMFETFNMGVGLILVVPEHDAGAVVEELSSAGETAWILGEVRKRADASDPVELV